MRHIARFGWFYATLGFWFFAAGLSSWALIYSPSHWKKEKIAEFSAEINGVAETNLVSTQSLPIENTMEETSRNWRDDGWNFVAGKTNLAGIFLNLTPKDAGALNALVQFRVFEKNDRLRLLALLARPADGQTYQWTSETSKDAVKPQDPSAVNFPLSPPSEAFNIFSIKFGHMKSLTCSIREQDHPLEVFKKSYISQGFSERPLAGVDGRNQFLLQKGPIQLFITIQEGPENCVFNLMQSFNF